MSPRKGLTAADIMTEHVVTGGPHDGLWRIANEMQRHNIGSVVIAEKEKILGILTERDFVRIVEQVGALLEKNLAIHHMSKPVLTVQSDAPVADVIKLMRDKHVRHLLVLSKTGDVAGIISSRDLMKVVTDVMSV
ncbi:MAG: CBS domain-containing protein [Candidatus Bathyarchaeia archaeon]|jgi:CBS domain-containing protein